MGSNARIAVRESAVWRAYVRSRYTILFCLLLLMLVALPAAATIGIPQIAIKLLFGTCLLAAVMPNATKRTRWTLFASVLLIVGIRLASDEGTLPAFSGAAIALYGIAGLLAAAGALRFALTAESVDRETICAALSTYLLAGLFLGLIYWSIEQSWPGSLTGADPHTELSCIYFSFVTLATLGYGDILPRSDIARGVAVLETIAGQLFLAVMVARLVAAFESPKYRRK
jgi:voltage-gated potassium channel